MTSERETPTDIIDIHPFKHTLLNPSENNKDIKGGSKIIVIGKPGTGKSTLIKYLLYLKSTIIPVGVCVSGTEESNKFYSSFIPELFIYDKYDEMIIEKFIARQKKAIHSMKNPWAFLLLDDCTENKKIFNNEIQQSLFKNGRHWKIFYILSLQYALDIPPAIRSSIDGVFIFKETNEKNLKILYDNYAGIIPSYTLFKMYMEKITGNYTALYIDNAVQNDEAWHTHVYYWKVPHQLHDIKIGCFEYRDFSNQRLKSPNTPQ